MTGGQVEVKVHDSGTGRRPGPVLTVRRTTAAPGRRMSGGGSCQTTTPPGASGSGLRLAAHPESGGLQGGLRGGIGLADDTRNRAPCSR